MAENVLRAMLVEVPEVGLDLVGEHCTWEDPVIRDGVYYVIVSGSLWRTGVKFHCHVWMRQEEKYEVIRRMYPFKAQLEVPDLHPPFRLTRELDILEENNQVGQLLLGVVIPETPTEEAKK